MQLEAPLQAMECEKAPQGLQVIQKLAVPTGFEPAISTLTGWHVEPGYTTGPRRSAESISQN